MTVDMSVTQTLQNIRESCTGVVSIVITDMNGVQLVAVGEDHRNIAQLFNAFKLSIEQSEKMGIGKQKCAVYGYHSSQIVMISSEYLVVFIVADAKANTGMLIEMQTKLEPVTAALLATIPTLREVHLED
uniref:Robl_LC7 domain-containing protein n=1 Tax=Steinernema glaseri TaxID=37863 RepID=A0A1I8A2M4_9BILA